MRKWCNRQMAGQMDRPELIRGPRLEVQKQEMFTKSTRNEPFADFCQF